MEEEDARIQRRDGMDQRGGVNFEFPDPFSHRYIPADADRQPRCQRLVSPLRNPSQCRLFNLPELPLYGMDDQKRGLERWPLFH